MILLLFLTLGCSAQAEQLAPEPLTAEVVQRSDEATRSMLALEAHLGSLTFGELNDIQQAADTLRTTCPYNQATYQLAWMLDAQVPAGAPGRDGVDAMVRVMGLLDLNKPERVMSPDEVQVVLDGVMAQAEALTDAEREVIDQANQTLDWGDRISWPVADQGLRWPPKEAFIGWRDGLRVDHTQLAELLDQHIGLYC